MGEQRVQLRQPVVETDLSLRDFWKFQPRNARGEWTSDASLRGLASRNNEPVPIPVGGKLPTLKVDATKTFDKQFKRVEKLRTAPLEGPVFYRSRFSRTTVSGEVNDKGDLTRPALRETFRMTHTQRDELFQAAGLKSEFHESETDLIHKWHETKDPGEKSKIEHEFEVRAKAHEVFFSTLREADAVARRTDKRNYFKRFDAHLRKSRVGRALLKVRDKIMRDTTLDKADIAKLKSKDFGKDWLKDFASSRLTAGLVSAVAVLAAHLAGSDAASESVRRFFENPAAETSILVATSLGLALCSKILARKSKPVAQSAKVKLMKVV